MKELKNLVRYWGSWVLLLVALLLVMVKLRIDAGGWSVRSLKSAEMCCSFIFVFTHYLVSMLLLLVCSLRSRIVAYVILPYVVILLLVSLYIHYAYGYVAFAEQITALMGTTWHEVSGLIRPAHWVGSVILVVLLFAGIWCMRRFVSVLKGVRSRVILGGFAVYVALSSGFVVVCAELCPGWLLPFLYGTRVIGMSESVREDLKSNIVNDTCPAYARRVLLPFYRQLGVPCMIIDWYMPSELVPSELTPSSVKEGSGDNMSVVFVIGESYRSDHASWNGYHRETLPQLSQYRDEIINFPYFASYATSTASSIYGLLTDATCKQRNAKSTSFIGLFKKHGYSAYLVLCRTTHWEYTPDIFEALDNKLDCVYEAKNSEEVENKVKELAALPGKKLIIIEDGTGHAPYEHEPQFALFGNQRTVDCYDNALLQTDDLLSRLVKNLSDSESVLLYASDHGQSFGEGGHYMHGGALSVVEQRHVFAFLWTSASYRSKRAEMITNIQGNCNKYLSHDDIYYSILSLGGVECAVPEAREWNFTLPLEQRPIEKEFILKD